jgi:hypothetical protein
LPKNLGGYPNTASAIKIIDNTVATVEDVVVSTNPTLMKGGLNLTGDLVVSEDVAVSGTITASSAVVDTITSGKFRATNILTNESDIFPNSDNITLNKTIATGIICGGGTLLFNLSISGFSATSTADTTLTFRLKDSSSITQATIVLIHRFNNANNIRSMSIPQSFTGVPAGTMSLDFERNDNNFKPTNESFLSIVLTEFPF